MSVQPYRSRDVIFGLERFYFDFDCEKDPDKAWKEARKFACDLNMYYYAKPLLVFSGCKGYHVYLWLWSTVETTTHRSEFVKAVYDRMQRKLLKGLKFETLDPAPIGDIKRLSRVPYSLHDKTGRVCQPVNLDGEPITIQSLEEYWRHGLGRRFLEKACREVKLRESWVKTRRPQRAFKPTGQVRPCIEAALKVPLDRGEGHKMRIAIATEYLNKGFSVPQVVDLFGSQLDFNESKTRYFIVDIQRKSYAPFRCKTIRDLGFCLGTSCPIYKSHR